ncbi:MAG: hypothetical protein AAF570_16305, partial [Bacteroidota bacterium]
DDKLRPWLVSIVKNRFCSTSTRDKKRDDVAINFEIGRGNEDKCEDPEIFEFLETAFRLLSGTLKKRGFEVLVAYFLEEKSQDEIMEQFGYKSINSTRATISNNLRRLQTWAQNNGDLCEEMRVLLESAAAYRRMRMKNDDDVA